MIKLLALSIIFLLACSYSSAQDGFEVDTIKTSSGILRITFIGHGTLMFTYGGKIIHIDPVSSEADYTTLPKADLILVTHEHGDHLDRKAVDLIRKNTTVLAYSASCSGALSDLPNGSVMKNGDSKTLAGIPVAAVPAYNIVHKRGSGEAYHPKGVGNGYILTFGDTKVYVAGDTENTPEMKQLTGIAIAFLPMNLPYTMTPEMVADAAKTFKPNILYPYHFGNTDTSQLEDLMKDSGIEVRVRKME